ncbi:peptidyl-glycine alpha-amidating monooxygenase B-like isoform X1 [Branchiostoma floridae]|uniref:Peptidyl-glycine alpha-amidating monooxygenase B-like isoform X1 n=1 Tax=Branchiostoma floridae TaxID=7739 RepID=A0A9J7HQH1_BRAFL|nr:peptidyl-glycine alpha-amidating monooxygenase B-like isoform X1 [Branchiostoma floridae]XP_035663630.1 peptidyl-glycine alpha-amidating monooxygenase B-like isoform X1 [Branchiostoma floridae]
MKQRMSVFSWSLLCLALCGTVGDASLRQQWAYDYPVEDGVFERQNYARHQEEEEEDVFEDFVMDVKMPGVFPRQDDAYLCTQIETPENTAYVTEFVPSASMNTAHHMILFGCSTPWTRKDVWDCGSMSASCRDGGQIMYAWARDAPPTHIPEDVGFRIGGDSGVDHLVLQVHYAHGFKDGHDLDHSGLSLHMTYRPQKYIAGVFLLASGYAHIPAHSKGVTVDLACGYDDPVEIHPFAFRTHAHGLGKVISGYVVRDGREWVELGRGNPQWPQAFYPVANARDKVIYSTDIVAARCVFDAEDRDEDTWIGATSSDEMCNFYMMYYTDPLRGETFKECSYPGDAEFFKDIPATSMVVPDAPEGGGLKEGWEEHVHMHHHHSHGMGEEDMTGMDESTTRKSATSTPAKPPTLPEQKVTTKQTEGKPNVITEKTKTVAREQHLSTESGTTKQREDSGVASLESTAGSQYTDLRLVPGWPDKSLGSLGQVAGVGVDSSGNVVIFHRGDHVWDAWTFDSQRQYREKDKGPIRTNTVISLNPQTGKPVKQWGKDFFYLPHGLTLDHEDNVWVTDVAMHQVFKFPPGGGDAPLLTLGEAFVPDWSTDHFCQPTDVAVETSGDFYVSDGYCNSRILKFDRTGKLLAVLGEVDTSHIIKPSQGFSLATQMVIPHSLALAEDRQQVCTADRENGRVVCFSTETGKPVRVIRHPEFGERLFAISYSPSQGGLLHAVNGPTDPPTTPVQGFTMRFEDGEILDTWPEKAFGNPHDVTCANSGVYVVEIGPNKVWKLEPSQDQLSVKKGDISSVQELEADTSDKATPSLGTDHLSRNPYESLLQSHRILKLPQGGNLREDLSTTLIIATVLVVPLVVVVIIAAVVRCRASGSLRFDKRKKSTLKSWMNGYKEKHQNGMFSNKKGFQRVKTEDSDHEEDPLTDSEVEEYNAVRSV